MQDGIKDCGICCLLSIIRFYGGDVSKEYLRELTNTTKDGVSFYDLSEAAKKIGFEVQGMSGQIENIKVNNLPCIVHFIVSKSYQHFVVLYEINAKKEKITLMDPAKGKKTISFSEFKLLTSNNYLFLKPIKQLPKIKKNKIIKKIIKNNIKQNRVSYIIIVFLTIAYIIINVLSSYNFKYFLEYSINLPITSTIPIIFTILIVLYVFKNINLLLKNILLHKWLSSFDNDTVTKTYKQILLLPYLYYKNRTTGEVISRFKDLNTTRNYLSILFSNTLTDILCSFIFLIIMFNYSKTLTLISLLSSLLVFTITISLSKPKKKIIKRLNKHEDIINTYLIEGISNVDTIKGSHLEKRQIDKFNLKYKSFLETIYKYNLFFELTNFNKSLINDFSYLLIYSIGSYLVIKDKLNLSDLIIFQTFNSYLFTNIQSLLNVIEEYPNYKLAKERVEELFMIDKEYFKNNFFYLPFDLKGDIVYQNLNYKIGTRTIFDNLNLTIKQGEKVLLSGASGSGKSTLMKMLLKYIETDYNSIKIANIDINHYHLENIRSNITYITSNEYLFNDTIKNNITLFKEYQIEEVQKVVDICGINTIIKDSSLGLDKLIEENGFNFSNGERQRIILARSIIKKTNIYIFDEALGQIDIQKEREILENLFKYLSDKTIIVISHRFNNKKLYDRVLKLEKGKIYESKKL